MKSSRLDVDKLPMDANRLEEIKDRLRRSSPGPWRAYLEGRDHMGGASVIVTASSDIEMFGATGEDYDFIANAKQDIPDLIAEVERLTKLLEARK